MSRQSRRREAAAAPAPARRKKRPGLRRPRGMMPRLHARLHRVARRRPFVVALSLALVHVLFALVTFEPAPHTGGDNAAYLTLARSLLEYGTYTELWDPLLTPHTKYPPVFPGILALALAVGLKPWVQLKLVVLAMSATAVAASYLWMRARARPVAGLAIGLLIAIAPGVLREGRWVLSDVPFWAFTMLALWAFDRLRGDADWKRFAPAAVAALLAYFTRSAGLPLVLAAIAWLAWRRQWKHVGALTLVIGVPAVLWWLRSKAYGPSGYASEFWLIDPYVPSLGRIGVGDMAQRMMDNNSKYIGTHLPILLGGGVSSMLVVASGLTFLLGIFGWLARMRAPRVAELFLPLYIGLIYIWPANWSGERFLLPVLALLLFYAAEALLRAMRMLAPRGAVTAGAAAFAVLVGLALPGLALATQVGTQCTKLYRAGEQFPCIGRQWLEYFELAPVSQAVLPDDAVVISRKPRLFYGLGGPRGIIYPLSDDPALFFAAADSVQARYVVLDRLGGLSDRYLLPIMEQYPRAFCIMLVTEETQTALFGLTSEPGARSPGAGVQASGGFTLCGPEFWRSESIYRQYTPPR